jgi:drug/metabolite transporter (DMT)-like permease
VVIYALVLFDERPSFLQWFGIALSLSIIFIAGSEKNDNDKVQKVVSYGLLFALASGFCTSISMLTGKFAVMHVAKLPYMTISYTMVALFTGVINRYRGLSAASVPGKQLFYYGGLIGIFNFLGYFLVLHAFATGPLSLIQGIFANSFTIPVILSALIYREEITKRRVLIVMLALLSVLFIKL